MVDDVEVPAKAREERDNTLSPRWNTITAALWKGERTVQLHHSENIDTQPRSERSRSPVQDTYSKSFPGNGNNDHRKGRSLGSQPNLQESLQDATEEVYTQEYPVRERTDMAEVTGLDSDRNSPSGPNVHFTQTPGNLLEQSQSQFNATIQESPDQDDTNRPHYFRNSSLMSKIRSLTPSSSGRQDSQTALAQPQDEGQSSAMGTSFPDNRRSFASRNADAEQELNGHIPHENGTINGQSQSPMPSVRRPRPFLRESGSDWSGIHKRRKSPVRRKSRLSGRPMSALEEQQGVSEDEGRERIARAVPWRRRSTGWLHRDPEPPEEGAQVTAETGRSGNKRFFNGFAGNHTTGAPSAIRRLRQEKRAQEAWQKLRASMKMIVKKTKAEEVDQIKSAELMAELMAGSPAALILASNFQRDEGDKKRIPVLLEQLKLSIPSSTPLKEDGSADRHMSFHIELEYGSGLMRMKWTIDRTLRDFANLHLNYKVQNSTQKYKSGRGSHEDARAKMPKFPKSAFPILRQMRGFADDEEEDETGEDGDEPDLSRRDVDGSPAVPVARRSTSHRSPARPSSGRGVNGTSNPMSPNRASLAAVDKFNLQKDKFEARQRKRLETYMQQLIRFVIFRSGSNRLCRFLEMSALGVRLASEGSYHGKEGTLVLQSGKGIDFRRAWRPDLLIQRHKPMWFLVRHSYLVCVDSPEEMNIYDVFLVDGGFQVQARRTRLRDQKTVQDWTKTAGHQARHPERHILRLRNHERKIRLIAKNERQLQQFEDSLKLIQATTDWSLRNRFDSFAPVRRNVFAQWLVDGRDYMWNVSRAISMAQDVIYIHDWWLTPEIYMRRPAAISQKWRLDRLLKRKAEEGVKIFVMVYRNINSAIPIDSEYTKFSLLDLHPNVFVQRSPNQLRQNTFFWAHHEKLCIVDHVIAFCGGIDICFGRWDTPQHSVADDKPTGFEATDMPLDADHCQLFPGKDYSNPRVLDFFKLDEPYGEMYDRTKVPRMPWHDIGMQIVGQPARDLSRHFVQRWNYILRQRKPTRPTPFLLPPPNFAPNELETLGLDGTCEIQMLRSACDWSIGTPQRVEHSILDAYVRLIQTSDHFVYIENQFFITSCTVEGTKIRNGIGDAIVERVIRAHASGDKWRAIIIIPLMPGFQNTVDAQDGSSVRLIMQCQYRSIDRGEYSMFERLRSHGIAPEDYIEFYSLRAWGMIGPNKALVTEQLYIHAKCMVVDDRYAIIGSANINERSMLGERDSEIAAIISDTDMLDSTMAGQPYKVGRFPHTLRMRLMREHLGVDVDAVMDEEREEQFHDEEAEDIENNHADQMPSDHDRNMERKLMQSKHRLQDDLIARYEEMHSFNHDVDWEQANNPNLLAHKKVTMDPRVTGNNEHRAEVEGQSFDRMAEHAGSPTSHGRDTLQLRADREVLLNSTASEGKGTFGSRASHLATSKSASRASSSVGNSASVVVAESLPPQPPHLSQEDLSQVSQLPPLPVTDDTDIGGPPRLRRLTEASQEAFSPLLASLRRPVVTKDCMKDPIADSFFQEVWHTVASNNTKLYRQVFRCMPDSHVTNWRDYEASNAYAEKFAHAQGMPKSNARMQEESQGATGPPGHGVSILTQPLAAVHSLLSSEPSGNAGQIDRSDELARMRSATQSTSDEKSPIDSPASRTKPIGQEDVSMPTQPLNEKSSLKFADTDKRTLVTPPPYANADVVNEKSSTSLGMSDTTTTEQTPGSARRRKRAGTRPSGGPMYGPDYMPSKEDAEELLKLVQGNLIEWPYDW